MSAHTPGPWTTRVDEHGVFIECVAEGWLVADFTMDRHEVDISREESLANARLSAAAPELRDVLKKIEYTARKNSLTCEEKLSDISSVVRRAIANALAKGIALAAALCLVATAARAAEPVCAPPQDLFAALVDAGQRPSRILTTVDGRELWVTDDEVTGARTALFVRPGLACVAMSGFSDVGVAE